MAPKKKDKGKLYDWMQCSLCGRLVSSQDAEAHSVSCDSDHGTIQGGVFHGKIIRAHDYLNEDGSVITQNIQDKDSVVWLAVPTMRLCGLSIGQLCIVNKILVKRSWPLKSFPLSKVALSDQSITELVTREDDMVTVERFFPNDRVVQSAVLTIREPSEVYERAEFLSFTAAYLDGKYISQGTPLTVKYFGQVCRCDVSSLVCDKPALPRERATPEHASPAAPQASEYRTTAGIHTPPRHTAVDINASAQGRSSPLADDHVLSTPTQDVSKSVADLDITSLTISPSTSTPKMCLRDTFPNLMTPITNQGLSLDFNTLSNEVFAKVSSKVTTFSVRSATESRRDVDQSKPHVSLVDLGGLMQQVEELKTRISKALKSICKYRCILLHGPPGTGKSTLVKALTHHLGYETVFITCTDILSKLFGEAESNLRQMFQSAQNKAPSIVVIDDIDVICPRRSQIQAGQQEHRIVVTLATLLDDLVLQNPHQTVIVIGITSNRGSIDPSLRRAGRFGCEVEIGVPTAAQRREILEVLLNKVPHDLTAENIDSTAVNAHGYVGADLCALISEAYMHSRSCVAASGSPETSAKLSLKDIVHAAQFVKPSALREIQLEVPQVKWTDIGGMSEVKMRLQEAVNLPRTNPEALTRLGIKPSKGLLMYGPPGCSKTMVARALATECSLNFLAVKGPELFNKYVGESEKAISEIFRKARSAAPSIIFFDEIDAISQSRGSSESGVQNRVLTQLLSEMDGIQFLKDVFIIAATNRPDLMDPALLRPGRFDSLVYVPLPDAETRRQILQKRLSIMPVAQDVSLQVLVQSTHNYSGAEIVQVCQEAALHALREDFSVKEIPARHFDAALRKVPPCTGPHLMEIYAAFSQSN
ncbi:hypothetical protein BsWGS_18362 [Bradybaena similaris]